MEQNTGKTKSRDMTEGVIWKHLLEFAIPMALGLLFQQLYNTVDSIVVGKFVGQNYGAGKIKRAREGMKVSLWMSILITMVLAALMMAFARPLMLLFTTEEEPEVLRYGVFFIRMVSPFYFIICFNQIYAGAMRGIGNSRTPMLVMLGSFVVFRQAYLAVTKALHYGEKAIALGYPVGWILCGILLFIFIRKTVLFRSEQGKEAMQHD